MKAPITIASLLFMLMAPAQNTSIGSAEKLVFTASYRMSGLMTDLAQVSMETSAISTKSGTLLRLKCRARTYQKWDNFFKINDLYESYVSPNSLNPYLHKREINEGGYYKFMQYKFKRRTNKAESLMRKRKKGAPGEFWEKKQNLSIGPSTFDLVTTIYKIRNLDIHKAAVGASDRFNVLFDNVEHTISVSLLGKETIKTALGNKECYKLAISINSSDVLKGKNDNLLWLTADANKIPVYAKFKVAIGSGELRIKSASGLKN